jgi:hypothetical protein
MVTIHEYKHVNQILVSGKYLKIIKRKQQYKRCEAKTIHADSSRCQT